VQVKYRLRLLFFLLLHGREAGGEVALTVAMQLGAIFIHAKIIDDKLLTQLVVEVQKGHDPRFDKHESQEANGDALFCRSLHAIPNARKSGLRTFGVKVSTK
jgi:hypothetical protein